MLSAQICTLWCDRTFPLSRSFFYEFSVCFSRNFCYLCNGRNKDQLNPLQITKLQTEMFFNNFVKRRLSSLLRPWLEQDPELDLQLGLISSIATAQNLRLDTSALNRELVDGSSSPRFIFKEFVIEEFVVRFSNWSATAFTFEARGIKVTLSYE